MSSKVHGRSERLKAPQRPHHPAPETQFTTRRRLRACHECDLVVALPPLKPREEADCPCCSHPLAKRHALPDQRSMSLALGALISLVLALMFPFVSFSTRGLGNQIDVTQSATQLLVYEQPVVALVVVLAVFVLPTLYLVAVVWLQFSLMRTRRLPWSKGIARSLSHIAPWLMADVFIVGTMVSLIKIAGQADVTIGIGFWAFIAYALLLLATTLSLDTDWLWFSLCGEPLAPEGTRTGEAAAAQNLTGCPVCGLIGRLDAHGKGVCQRCGEHLHARRPASLQRCWALLFTSVVLYIPANIYPITHTTTLGSESASTIIGGVIYLASHGSWPVAMVIFIASVIVPIGKLLALAWLCLVTPRASEMQALTRTRLYRLTELIGRWSMVDVFVVAILSALLHAGALLSVTPGAAILPFAGMVVVTMLAAMSFDPRLLWNSSESGLPPSDATVPVDEQGSTS